MSKTNWSLYQAIFVAGATAAASNAIPSSIRMETADIATNGLPPGTSRRRQAYRPMAAKKMAATSGGQMSGV